MARTTPPDRINAANAANRRRGDEAAASRLREHGWLVVAPEFLPPGRHVVPYVKTIDGTVCHDLPE